uniref:Uncharacterized protein n=1 Tax=Romanomermis culicivorax TaxID=13658 RepID=A0A915J903_ROMCU
MFVVPGGAKRGQRKVKDPFDQRFRYGCRHDKTRIDRQFGHYSSIFN